jgi:hypothetical protein
LKLLSPLLQQCVPIHSRFQTPITLLRFFFLPRPFFLLLLSLVITFLPLCHSL